MKRKTKEAVYGILYILPSFILIFGLCVIPIFLTGYFSFTNYNIMNVPSFLGLENYSKLWRDSYLRESLENTLVYVLVTVPFQTVFALVFAAFLADKLQNRLGGFLRSVIFIPAIASAVTSGTIWRIVFSTENGLLNALLGWFHISPVNWLGSSATALFCICVVAIWKNVGYFLVIYYAGIMGVPRNLYEAARVDGAGAWQQFVYITLPVLRPITYLVITLGIIWSFQVFDLAYQMTGGGPGHSTVTIVMGIYNAAFKQYKMGYACAMAMVLLLLIVLVNTLQNFVFREGKKE